MKIIKGLESRVKYGRAVEKLQKLVFFTVFFLVTAEWSSKEVTNAHPHLL